ncbi:hypothetical protein Microterr_23310 [Microbacterium terricola]|uniref:ABC-2 type transport system permease protein n=2 Tax=Microbacterium terricola TaxID=344163 RepID=A0ABM8E1R9_9MICO|nr:hypothetical protein Microterr_23310 [Microbacterium terricola]
MRTVPERQRADLGAELRASIDDQIDARLGAGEPAEIAEREVLTGLGDPDKLAAGYTDRPLHLIGPKYYLDWWRLLKLLMWIVPPFAAFGVALGMTLAGDPFGSIVGTTVTVVLQVIVHLGFWVTFVFVLVERYSTRATEDDALVPWTLDQLPQPRQSGAGLGEMLTSVVGLVVGVGAIIWDQVIGFVPGVDISFLDPGLWPWWLGGLFLVMAVQTGLQVVVYLVGRWTMTLAGISAALTLVASVPALWLLSQDRLINPQFWTTVIPDDGAEVGQIVSIVAGFGIAAGAIWAIIDVFLKARRAR